MREGEGVVRRYPAIPVLVASVLVSAGAASVFLFLPITLASRPGLVAVLGSIAVTAVASVGGPLARARAPSSHPSSRDRQGPGRAARGRCREDAAQVEMATAMLAEGRDPLVVSPEMRWERSTISSKPRARLASHSRW
jgi:hypothetical protein